MFLDQTRRRLGLPLVEKDKRKLNALSTIRLRQTAFAGVTMAGKNGAIISNHLAQVWCRDRAVVLQRCMA